MSARRTRVSARVRIRENDAHKEVLPPPADTGFVVGVRAPFSENRAIDFVTGTVVYPTMLYSGSSLSDVGGILAEGRQTPGASDVHFNIDPGVRSPFREIVTAQTSSRLVFDGAQESFAAPLGSRHAITIDITPSETKYVYRCPQNEIDRDPDGEFDTEGTGFCYFNFVTNRWDDIGRTDPITGGRCATTDFSCEFKNDIELYFAPPVTTNVGGFELTNRATGSDRYMGQFVPPNHANQRLYEVAGAPATIKRFTSDMQLGIGTHKIGQPTVAFFAPFATKYHATQSNVLKMSDYISEPFLLEKIKIEVPVVARRNHLLSSIINPYTRGRDLHLRDMDNYVFFLYRQVRFGSPIATRILHNNLGRDQLQDATSSDRFLIASASVCFYNSPTITSSHQAYFQGLIGATPLDDTPAYISSSFPLHSPNFKHDFLNANIEPVGTTSAVKFTSLFSGTLHIEMTPSVTARGRKGSTPLPFRTPGVNFAVNAAGVPTKLGNALNYVQHVWPGTPGGLPYGSDYIDFETAPYLTYFSGKFSIDAVAALTYTHSGSTSTKKSDTWYSWAGLNLYHTFDREPTKVNQLYGANALKVSREMSHTASYLSRPEVFSFTNQRATGLSDIRSEDPRFFLGATGPGDSSEIHAVDKANLTTSPYFGTVSETDSAAKETPILLMPEDDLILGIDAGITPYEFITPSITGSFLKIETRRAVMTLYGSFLAKGERRQHHSVDQFSNSNVNQDIMGRAVVDELLLDPLVSTYGNYHAPLATSSLGSYSIDSPTGRMFQWQQAVFAGEGAAFTSASYMPNPKGDIDPVRNFKQLEIDWFKYPRVVSLRDSGATAIDGSRAGSYDRRYVFRNDRFGQFANILYTSPDVAAKITSKQVGNTTIRLGGLIETYPVTTEITGATSYTQNASLHSTASFPYFET
jgi:hypothetical protein